jgi:diaminopimelate epimerase
VEFAKLHGLGNDFIVAKAGTFEERPLSLGDLARRACDRHCGIGADGVLFYEVTTGDAEADFSALIYNADGSRAEISGNGVRCLAASLHFRGETSNRAVRIRTTVGIKTLELISQKGPVFVFRTSLGHPITDASRVGSFGRSAEPTISLPIGEDLVTVTITSMGNPHCSTFWPDLDVAPFDRLGPAIENHPWFANRTNVEFIQVLNRHRLRVRFWERGVGATLASGTGSSAAAVASVLNGFVESPVTVETALGSLLVEWNPGAELFLTGPAEFICRGDYAFPGGTA